MSDPKITIRVEGSGLPAGGADGQVLSQQNGKPVWVEPPKSEDSLPLAGGTLKGDLNIGSTSDPSGAQLRIAKQGADGKGYQMGSYISGGNMARTDYIADGSISNFIQLGPAETGFGKPVRVSSGGTGVTSLEELKTKLAISEVPSGASAHQQLVTDAEGKSKWADRPYYKESSFYSPNELSGMELFPCNITVEATEHGNVAEFPFARSLFHDFEEVRVIFDGEEYSCVVKATSDGTKYIGGNMETMNFDEYPFIIVSLGAIVTKTAGEHTIDASVKSSTIVANYMPKLTIKTSKTGDGVHYITENDLQRIATAYQNNIPIYIDTGYDNLGMIMHVIELNGSFIFASCSRTDSSGCVAVYTHMYSRSNGNLYRKGKMIQGTVSDEGINAPVMYINNRYYRIGISDSGTLTATEVT